MEEVFYDAVFVFEEVFAVVFVIEDHVGIVEDDAVAELDGAGEVEEAAFVVGEDAVVEEHGLGGVDVDEGEFPVAEELAAVKDYVGALVDVHDVIGAVTDLAAGHCEVLDVAEVDAFSAAAEQVAFLEGDVGAVLESEDAFVAVAFFGVAEGKTLELDV